MFYLVTSTSSHWAKQLLKKALWFSNRPGEGTWIHERLITSRVVTTGRGSQRLSFAFRIPIRCIAMDVVVNLDNGQVDPVPSPFHLAQIIRYLIGQAPRLGESSMYTDTHNLPYREARHIRNSCLVFWRLCPRVTARLNETAFTA